MLFVLLPTCSFSYADDFRSKSCVFYICSGRFRTKAFTDSVYISRVTPGIIRGTYISQWVGLKCRHQMNYDNQLRYRPGELLCTSMSDFTISPHRCFLMRNLPVYRNTFHWELSPQWTSETTKREKVPPPPKKNERSERCHLNKMWSCVRRWVVQWSTRSSTSPYVTLSAVFTQSNIESKAPHPVLGQIL